MNDKWTTDQTRIQAAKELLANAIDSLVGTPNLEVALRVYGHQSPITLTSQDCADTKLEVPFSKDNFTKIKYRIKSIEAKGTTPIARSLEAAASDFPDTNSINIIILITDGLEACDNDPCVIAKKLHDKGVRVTPFVIGLGISATAPKYLFYLDYYVKIYVSLFLIWSFNPFNRRRKFTSLDRKISLTAGIFVLFSTTSINKIIIDYLKNILNF